MKGKPTAEELKKLIGGIRITRKCIVCEQYEDEKADMCNDAAAWLCPECKKRINEMLYSVETRKRTRIESVQE